MYGKRKTNNAPVGLDGCGQDMGGRCEGPVWLCEVMWIITLYVEPLQRRTKFIEAIHLVQCGYVPPLSLQPFGWPYQPEGEECDLHTQSGSHRDVMDSLGDEPADLNTSIEDIWIGAANDATNDVLPGSQPEYHSSEGDELEASSASAETLINIHPASQFKWFITVCHYGVGLFSDIHTAHKLHSTGMTVHYFTMLHEAQAHFKDVFNVWCGEAA
ncbi:hypothetical protein EDB19DRAFT_1835077 [Suillus lakei]|nr:hypothetical protein EDB19DRAFT_1835077 [Suillus lakei]